MGNEFYTPYSVNEYKGIKTGQRFTIGKHNCTVYRIDDKKEQVTFVSDRKGFCYIDVDDLLKIIEKDKQ